MMTRITKRTKNGWIPLLILLLVLTWALCGCQDAKKGAEKKAEKKTAKKSLATPRYASTVSLEEYPNWLKQHLAKLSWPSHDRKNKLSRQILQDSFKLGRQFLINNQKPAGNFNYQYDFVKKIQDKGDNQVRQAGALWGISLCYLYQDDQKTREALDKGLEFFFKNTRKGPIEGSLVVEYPGDTRTESGTVALVALSITEYFRAQKARGFEIPAEYKAKLIKYQKGYLEFLKWMRLENKHFAKHYSLLTQTKTQRFSPYFDGETMLCLIKTAKYLDDYKDLIPIIEDSAMTLAKEYTIDEWVKNPDSDQTKGFFQWSCMSFWEYYDAGWKNAETFGDYTLAMAWWMLHTHHTLKRRRNTAYAYEGIIHAYKTATGRKNEAAAHDLAYTIDKGLYKLTKWQVGGPLADKNRFLVAHPTDDPIAVGGIMNHRKEAPLRIDVTQHQMHAVILALTNVYKQ